MDGSCRTQVGAVMGIGDEIMVTGEVKRLVTKYNNPKLRVGILDLRKTGRMRWHEIWEGNPNIVLPGGHYDVTHANGGGNRPYIQDKGMRAWTWKPYTPEPGAIYLTDAERAWAEGYAGHVLVNPTIKAGASPNKLWPLARWIELVSANPHIPWLQVGAPSDPRVCKKFVATPTFRHAVAVLAVARAAVLHEGGLHHAAAAVGTRSVVIYGGFISPKCTGYNTHANLFADSDKYPLGCGMRVGCFHCESAMKSITTRHVARHLEAML